MNKIIHIFILAIFLPAILFAAEPAVNVLNTFPDLLGDDLEPQETELLDEDPFIADPDLYLNDPIFEDDFTLARTQDTISDPLEPMNRFFFEVNDILYFWVLKPAKTGYRFVVPYEFRLCVGNFFSNISAPIRFVNNVLQGEFEDAGVVLGRFMINSTLGVFGLGDPASVDFDIEPREADFGQTLGKWGVGEGVYLCLPVLGPSSLRDGAGLLGDVYLHPVTYYAAGDIGISAGYYVVDNVNAGSLGTDVYEEITRIALDPYVAARQAYYEYRKALIEE
ncbi:MAG: VacJ family lipoprotein [Desulfobulbaceae bacterium]|nr:MAG: VacJ family lipoprotein [Desulfobulbaceae bacterium]